MPNSLIFVVILAVWAAYLIQHWIRRRDHVATARSVDRFSEAMRVLERRQSMPRADISTPKQRSYSLSLTRPAHPEVVVKRARRGGATAQQRGASLRQRQRPSAATLRAVALLVGVIALVAGVTVSVVAASWWGALAGVATLLLAVTFVRFSVESTRRRATSSLRADARRAAPAPAGRPAARRTGATPARRTGATPARRTGATRTVSDRGLLVDRPASTPSAPMVQTSASGAREGGPVSARTTELYDVDAVESPVRQDVTSEADVSVIEPVAPAAEAEPGTWAPVPVPPPTYTLKARAPRRPEPRSESVDAQRSQASVEELPFDGHALALDEEFEDLPPVHFVG